MVIITYETIKNTAATAVVDKGCEELRFCINLYYVKVVRSEKY